MTAAYAADLAVIKGALAPNADILVYGCDFALGADGDRAAHALAQLTGANVAAATHFVGADAGASWALNDQIGSVHTQSIALSGWGYDLASYTFSNAIANYTFALDGSGNVVVTDTISGSVDSATLSSSYTSLNFSDITGITLTRGNNSNSNNITGTSSANQIIVGGSGSGDTLKGGASNAINYVWSGTGLSDTIRGGGSSFGSTTTNYFYAGTGASNNVYGGDTGGNTGATQNNTIYGAGTATLYGGTITGGSLNVVRNIIYGGSGAETITGGTIYGGTSGTMINIIYAGSGNETIYGGTDAGTSDTLSNTVVYSGNRANYTVSYSAGTYTIVDTRSGSPNGTDTVQGIGTFQFADGSVSAANLMSVYAGNDTGSTTANTALTKSLAGDAESPSGYTLTYSKASNPSHGTVTINSSTGSYTYTPASNYLGSDSFTYSVSDGHGGTATATVTITVSDAVADSYTVITGAPIVVDPRTNDSVSGGYKTATITAINGTTIASGQTITLGDGTTVTMRSDGRLAVTAAQSGGATESFTYTLSDSLGLSTGTVTLTEYNDAAHAQALGFVFTVDTTKAGTSNSYSIILPVNTGTTAANKYTVFWGDGTSTSYTGSTSPSHTYASAGSHTIAIVGEFAGLDFFNGGDCKKLTGISQWGDVALQNLSNAFEGCSNLVITATDTPDFSDVTSTAAMFYGTSVNPNLSGVDVSNVTDMSYMFYNDAAFNQNISGWNTSNVANMNYMFYGDTAFNQNIGSWNTSNVTSHGSDVFPRYKF